MKKFILITIALLLSLSLLTYKFYNEDSIEEVPTKNIKQSSMLSMMLETENGSGKYEMTTSSSWPTDGYVFNSELSKCKNGGTLSWDDANKKVMFEGNNVDKCYVYFDVYVPPTVVSDVCSRGETLSSCITTLSQNSTSLYTNIYHHDGTLENGINDGSYRYAGASESVNNFVCFGSNGSTCLEDNLYRIIGVFGDQVKLIKYDYANGNLLGTDGEYRTSTYSKSSFSTYKGELTTINRYNWNHKANNVTSNTWSTSLFNKTNLNTNYLNNIGTKWSNLIEDTTWKVSGHTTYDVTPKAMYTAEITNATKTYGPENGTSKIGLMYVSDYGFAAATSEWTSNMSSYNSTKAVKVNWMYMGLLEWTITPCSSNSYYVFAASNYGNLGTPSADNGYGVRPVLYLKASVAYAGGSGTKDSPITLTD